MTDRELMQQALDAMLHFPNDISDEMFESIRVLRARLAQPEPDDGYCQACEGNYCTAKNGCVARDNPPPQREWQGLTENEIKHLWYEACQTNLELTSQLIVHLARNIEVKLREKNHG